LKRYQENEDFLNAVASGFYTKVSTGNASIAPVEDTVNYAWQSTLRTDEDIY
jgi:hypothetical protein